MMATADTSADRVAQETQALVEFAASLEKVPRPEINRNINFKLKIVMFNAAIKVRELVAELE